MSNAIPVARHKSLKLGFWGFCYFVRGREGNTTPRTRAGSSGDTPIHNNKNNNIICIKGIAGGSVASGGIL